MKKRLIALFVALVGLGLIVFSFMFLFGNPWGAAPALIGCYLFVMGIGVFVNPLMQIVFKSDYDC